jgi:putative two-component system response regulator
MIAANELLNSSIVIIDDEPANVMLLERLLDQHGYTNVQGFINPEKGWEYVSNNTVDLLLLDLQMPKLSGLDILRMCQEGENDRTLMPVMVLTADTTAPTKRRALSLGAQDFLTKPFETYEVTLRVKNLLRVRASYQSLTKDKERLEAAVQMRTQDLMQTQVEIVERLGLATEYRDDDTKAHTFRVGEMAAAIAEELGMDKEYVNQIRLAAPLHDLGKIGIPDNILLKPGKLTPEEYDQMKKHSEIGASILSGSSSELLKLAEEIALTHHERWDGSGYPRGLKGTDIPLSGRIVAVVDVFDALTHARAYKPAWSVADAIDEIRNCSGTQFDPDVVCSLISRFNSDERTFFVDAA